MKRLKGLKRLVAVAAASMLLCGFTCQAALGSGEETDPKPQGVHAHSYIAEKECTYTVFLYQHRYLVSSTLYPSGEAVSEYAYCDVVRHFYRYVKTCKVCGAQEYETCKPEDKHMSCGQ